MRSAVPAATAARGDWPGGGLFNLGTVGLSGGASTFTSNEAGGADGGTGGTGGIATGGNGGTVRRHRRR